MEEQDFVELIEGVRNGDSDAEVQLWNQYFSRLQKRAIRTLQSEPGRHQDAEDLALSVLRTVFRRLEAGQFKNLAGDVELFRLLNQILYRKYVDWLRHEGAQKRGNLAKPESLVDGIFDSDALPAEIELILKEELEARLQPLDQEMQDIVKLRLEGYSVDEIAEKTVLSPRTIARRLSWIRKRWRQELE